MQFIFLKVIHTLYFLMSTLLLCLLLTDLVRIPPYPASLLRPGNLSSGGYSTEHQTIPPLKTNKLQTVAALATCRRQVVAALATYRRDALECRQQQTTFPHVCPAKRGVRSGQKVCQIGTKLKKKIRTF